MENLIKNEPSLILASITPFGQNGPWRNYKASDLVGAATGGLLFTCVGLIKPRKNRRFTILSYGIRTSNGRHNYGLYQRTKTQKGKHIDVSVQASIPVNLMVTVPIYQRTGRIRVREGDKHTEQVWGSFLVKMVISTSASVFKVE